MLAFKATIHKSKDVLEYVHLDLWGPTRISIHCGSMHFLSLIDDYFRKVWLYLLQTKDEHTILTKVKEWKALVENQTSKKVKVLRTDNGLEFCNEEFEMFCKNQGILRHKTVRNTPQQNGLAEMMNRTLLDRVKCMLYSSGLFKRFLGEVVMIAFYLVNKTPSSAIDFKTLKELWSGKPSNYNHLRIFRCKAYVHQSEEKLEPRSMKCIFLGYPEGVKGYRL